MQEVFDELIKYVDIVKRQQSRRTAEKFYDSFIVKACFNSNAIEGNTYSLAEVKSLLDTGIIPNMHSLRESEDIVGYKQAFDFLYESVKGKKPITEEFIKQIHSFVLRGDEEAGKYRTIQNYVGSLTRIVYMPCPPTEVPEKMKAYSEELQADCKHNAELAAQGQFNWVELFHNLAKHHIEFENIHPFVDGNGRTGRLLLIYEMISLGLLPADVRYEERDRYYAAIKAYRDKEKYSTRPESKTEGMAKLLAESELASMKIWLSIYSGSGASQTNFDDDSGAGSGGGFDIDI